VCVCVFENPCKITAYSAVMLTEYFEKNINIVQERILICEIHLFTDNNLAANDDEDLRS
jgi:hypothetical protein